MNLASDSNGFRKHQIQMDSGSIRFKWIQEASDSNGFRRVRVRVRV